MSAAVGFAERAVPQVVVDLEPRSLGSDEDREAWLEARRSVITATEAKQLVQAARSGNPTNLKRTLADLISEKLDGSKFFGNHFTEWGKMREPVILDMLERRYGMRGCGLLIHAEGNSRHAATPDGAGVDFDGLLVLTEIKTSKNDVSFGTAKFDQAGYLFQMQWQMYCTGARRVLYVVERHDDDWLGWDLRDRSTWRLEDGPRVAPLVSVWVERDDAVIAEMVALADAALVALDEALAARAAVVVAGVAGEVVEAPGDALELVSAGGNPVAALVETVLAARVAESAAKKQKEAAWGQLLGLGERFGDYAGSGDVGSVRFIAPVTESVERIDEEAARAALPKEWAQLDRARKRVAALEESFAAAAVAGSHVSVVERVGKPSLTVTAPKKGKK